MEARGFGGRLQFDEARDKSHRSNVAAVAVAAAAVHLRCNKLLVWLFFFLSVGKQDFRASTKINVSLKFMQCRATF